LYSSLGFWLNESEEKVKVFVIALSDVSALFHHKKYVQGFQQTNKGIWVVLV